MGTPRLRATHRQQTDQQVSPPKTGRNAPLAGDFSSRQNSTTMQQANLNSGVTRFLDEQNHPLRKEIEQLRLLVLSAGNQLTENIKWNGPNYCAGNNDRITMKIHPPKQIQLIFHCGAKVRQQPEDRLIKDDSGLLVWKENNRAVATFKNSADIEARKTTLPELVKAWIQAV